MSLLVQLTSDMKSAMRARDKPLLATLRLLISDLKYLKLEKQRDLDDKEELAFLSTQAKRRRESIEAYDKAEREDLSSIERGELKVIERYLPQQLSVEEARKIVEATVAETGASSRRDFGLVMRSLMPKLRGRFPGKEVKPLVEEFLS